MFAREPSAGVSPAGVAAGLGASFAFGVIFIMPPFLAPLSASQILGYRIVLMVGFVALLFSAMRIWSQVGQLLARLRSRPMLLVVVIVDASLLGLQLWLFGWAPLTGHGLELALGYLMMPLVMAGVGVIVFGERLSQRKIVALALAAMGVVVAVATAASIGWSTLLVAVGLPLYFTLRRAWKVDGAAAQFLELLVMLPFTAVVLIAHPSFSVLQDPTLLTTLLALGALSAVGFTLYLAAGRLLPFAVFGVLTYVEPLLLVAASLLILREGWGWADAATYIPIALSLCVLTSEALSSRRPKTAAA